MKENNEFPKTLQAAIKHFADPDVALNFMVSIRWPAGVKCPRCGSDKVSFTAKRRVWTCECCPNRRQFSIKVGTIMEDSPISLDKWLIGMWLIVSAKNGISSYELHRTLGITQKSAWFLGHRIRLALQNGTFEKLSGEIEADETYIGGKVRNMHVDRKRKRGRGTGGVGKAIVMGLLERRSKAKASTVKMKHVPNKAELEFIFNGLAKNWQEATRSYSLSMRRFAHPTYQVLMHTLGKEKVRDVVPLILRELQQRPDAWFEALKVLTNANPAQNSKTFDEAVAAWIAWGKEEKYIS